MSAEPASQALSAERIARAGLSRVIERGTPEAASSFGTSSPTEAWERLKARGIDMAAWLPKMQHADPERDLERAAAIGARFVIPGDDEWPHQLSVLARPGGLDAWSSLPFGLWVRGPANLREVFDRSIAVIGARASSAYGEHIAGELAAGLAEKGVTVVSGGSYGIDAAAHRGVLAVSGRTVAVLASGIDVHYPRGNSALFDRIAEAGLMVSELPPGSAPTRHRMYARNRLIAAPTRGTVVAEAGLRSGTLNTAGWARRCGRLVMAVPGPITSAVSAGTHKLIQRHGAVLVTSVDDILELASAPADVNALRHERMADRGIDPNRRIGRAVDHPRRAQRSRTRPAMTETDRPSQPESPMSESHADDPKAVAGTGDADRMRTRVARRVVGTVDEVIDAAGRALTNDRGMGDDRW
jgi:DNA processing protein